MTPDLEAAMAAYTAKDYPRAAALFTPIVAREPDNIIAWYHRGQAHHQMGEYAAAAVDLSVATRLAPRDPRTWRRRAAACLMAGRDEEADGCASMAAALAPKDAEVRHLQGGVFWERGYTQLSVEGFQRAVDLDPTRTESKVGLAMSLLRAGRWAEAWPLYEERRHIPSTTFPLYPGIPFWDGRDPLAGDAILVRCEQGYGDSLQFVRYIPMLQALGADVVLETRPTLRRLFDHSFPHLHQIAEGEAIPRVDWQTSLMSLPLAFGTTPDNIPAPIPYLRARTDDWDDVSQRLPRAALRVGIRWRGGAYRQHPDARAAGQRRDLLDSHRRLLERALAEVAALSGRHIHLVSLQEEDLPSGDWADTAGLIEDLHLVISVDTAVAHLAGAMGKPVWLLNRLGGCWRWLEGREDTSWYPTMRLFNQARAGDWDEVIGRVKAAFGEWVRG